MALLSATKAKSLTEAGRYSAGEGLYLVIDKRGGKSWVVRVQ